MSKKIFIVIGFILLFVLSLLIVLNAIKTNNDECNTICVLANKYNTSLENFNYLDLNNSNDLDILNNCEKICYIYYKVK